MKRKYYSNHSSFLPCKSNSTMLSMNSNRVPLYVLEGLFHDGLNNQGVLNLAKQACIFLNIKQEINIICQKYYYFRGENNHDSGWSGKFHKQQTWG